MQLLCHSMKAGAVHTKRIAFPPRLQGGAADYDEVNKCWRVWLHTVDFVYGTCLELSWDGTATRVVVRADEGDERWKLT